MIYMNHKENIIVTRSGNRLISHRGNITGKTKHENDPEYIIADGWEDIVCRLLHYIFHK